jgi:hypothetical protein
MDLDGKINFFVTFYVTEDDDYLMTALTDMEGFVYAATKKL